MHETELLPLLTVVGGSLQGASYRVRPGQRVVGRDEGVDIRIEDRKVSRRHARLDLVDGEVTLTDLGSTNGTWVNGLRIGRGHALCNGDLLRIGGVELRFFDPGSAPTEPVAPIRHQGSPLVPRQAMSPIPASPPNPALVEPTEAYAVPRRPTRVLLALGGCVALAGIATWVLLVG